MKLKTSKGEIVMKRLADELKGEKPIGVKRIKRPLSIHMANVLSQKNQQTSKLNCSTHFGKCIRESVVEDFSVL
jgi:hypothetical protein